MSTEAKYIGQTAAPTNVMWTESFLKKLQIKGAISEHATPIYANNQEAISLANNLIFQKCSKHINIRYCYTRDLIKQGKIKLVYQNTHNIIANGLTKPLGPIKFAQFVDRLELMTVELAKAAVEEAGI